MTAGTVLVCDEYENTIRWRDGERFQDLFEARCDRLRESGRADQLAVHSGAVALRYDELDARANRLARFLLSQGIRAGDRIALLFDEAVPSYAAMLAVLKIHAAYVPLDPGFPPDRLAYIAADAGVRAVLTLSHLRPRLADVTARPICLDEVRAVVDVQPGGRLSAAERGDPVDELCYIIYTSGTTGRPKGVAIEHASICNFVRVAAEVYGIRSADRVYQGMTIAFDFAVEELWVPLVAGATLVPKPAGATLLGHELWEFLHANDVTALACVPTLLATLDDDLPGLRFLLVSGEACPQHLITRWHRPGRVFLNVYGPTETTVTATWTRVHPERPVTIGVPLPTYSVVILDPARPTVRDPGELGEIGIAGIGLSSGYLNRADLTDRAFIPDFLGIDRNPSGRIYRTGDLGRVNDSGEIEYHGRIDTQVKIRGYRIELTEIESVLLRVAGIAQAAVGTYEPRPGAVELVGYYSLRADTDRVDREHLYRRLRDQLPGYMVPAYLEELPALPMLPSDKVDRRRLPTPTGQRSLGAQQHYRPPTTDTEAALAAALGHVLDVDQVSVDSDFFADLGANSLLLAHFCTRLRERPELPTVSMKDVYLHPTISELATALDLSESVDAAVPAMSAPVPAEPVVSSTWKYLATGAAQFLIFIGYAYLLAGLLAGSYEWVAPASGWADRYLRSIEAGTVAVVVLCAVPILAKWLLVGRWKPGEIRLWSLGYLRFWLVKTLVRTNPLVLFVGSPIYPLYLRALGAKIGKGVVIFSRNVPMCTDLLHIGSGTVIRKDAFFTGYRAEAGVLRTGAVTMGEHVFVGERSVLDIDTVLGHGAQLGHASALHTGQTVPANESWHGSPAQPSTVDYQTVAPARCGSVRRAVFGSLQILSLLVVWLPLGLTIAVALLRNAKLLARYPWLKSLVGEGQHPAGLGWRFYVESMGVSFAVFFLAIPIGLYLVVLASRLLAIPLRRHRVYPLYGVHYWLQRTVARVSNLRFYMQLFGDSSYIVPYVRALGYDLSEVRQTGSNFGVEQKHEVPTLMLVGSGTMVSDGLSTINAEFSSTSFRVVTTAIGADNFLGNDITFPAGGRVGENCLLGTKTLVPLDGPVRANVGLLGSPSFEIPRTVQRDRTFDEFKTGAEFRLRLAAKNRHNIGTIVLFLLMRWVHFTVLLAMMVLVGNLYGRFGTSVVAVDAVLSLGFSLGYFALAERAGAAFRALRPRFCSIYDPYFWWHERFWKMNVGDILGSLNGTPFKNVVSRLLGVRIGRRVFDDGAGLVEKSLVRIGDDCTLNIGSTIQAHSLEDGTFKSDEITLGPGCTLGVAAFVHYGVSTGAGSVLDADAFLMKGSALPPRSRWRGNPAREIVAAPLTRVR